jgi:hypothetical protein
MFNTKIPTRSAVALLLVVAGSAGCSKDSKNATAHAERADETSGQMTQTESLRATVQSINEESRTVTMRDEEGHTFEVEAGESVDLNRLHPNDSVLVVYQESVAFELQDPNEAPKEPVVEENSRRSVPNGVQFGRKIETTVEIVSVAPDGAAATFRGPSGAVRTVQVADARNQQKVANLKPGDAVGVIYTERLAVDVDPSRK